MADEIKGLRAQMNALQREMMDCMRSDPDRCEGIHFQIEKLNFQIETKTKVLKGEDLPPVSGEDLNTLLAENDALEQLLMKNDLKELDMQLQEMQSAAMTRQRREVNLAPEDVKLSASVEAEVVHKEEEYRQLRQNGGSEEEKTKLKVEIRALSVQNILELSRSTATKISSLYPLISNTGGATVLRASQMCEMANGHNCCPCSGKAYSNAKAGSLGCARRAHRKGGSAMGTIFRLSPPAPTLRAIHSSLKYALCLSTGCDPAPPCPNLTSNPCPNQEASIQELEEKIK